MYWSVVSEGAVNRRDRGEAGVRFCVEDFVFFEFFECFMCRRVSFLYVVGTGISFTFDSYMDMFCFYFFYYIYVVLYLLDIF